MKTIKLNSKGFGRYDNVSPIIIANGNLELEVNLPAFNGEYFFIGENNEAKYKTVIPQDGRVTLDGLTAGELQAKIAHYLNGVLIKTYTVEPLILREVDGSLSGMPEIAELKEEIAVLNSTVNRLTDNLGALIRFAFKDYNDNIYLKGGSVGEFLKEFGFELTNDETKTILGGKNND